MIDLRVYRAALIPTVAAFIVMMFSLQGRPEPLTADLAPDAFDGGAAVGTAREIVEQAPDREPGSEGNRRIAQLVRERFRTAAGGGGRVFVQRFRSAFEGNDTEMQNVALVLPGNSDARLVVMAHRDSASGVGAATSAAATGALLEIANTVSQSRLRKTIVLVSTDGGEAGAAGAREFAEDFTDAQRAEAAIVIDQPAARRVDPPVLMPWSTGPQTASISLVQSAKTAIRRELGTMPEVEGTFGHFFRLAFPIAQQEQAVLVRNDIEAVTISAGGELRLRDPEDRLADLSTQHLGQTGRAALALLLALDSTREEPDDGPGAYVVVGGQLLPGWAIALFAFALLIPPLLAAVDGLARARRRRVAVLPWVRWVAGAALPFIVALVLAYLLAVATLIPRPTFPYDPREYPIDAAAIAALAILAAAMVATWRYVRPLVTRPPAAPYGAGPAAAVCLVLAVALLALWIRNPYLALLLTPAAHLWLFAALPELHVRPRTVAAIALAGGILPLLGLIYVADKLDVGLGIAWHLVLMTTGGHVGPVSALLACLLAGCLVAALTVAQTRRRAAALDG